MSELEKDIAGALKQAIDAHGPITLENRSSAAKRIAHAIREAAKRERDRLMTTQPREPRS